jgi:hypothetical protein
MSMAGSVQVEVHSGCTPLGRSGSSRVIPIGEQDEHSKVISAAGRSHAVRGTGREIGSGA